MSETNGADRTARVRRVVTGTDEQGRSTILSDSLAPNVFRSPSVRGFGAAQIWTTDPGPVSNEGHHDPATHGADIPMWPALGGTIFRIADFPPDSAYGNQGEDNLFGDIGGHAARDGAAHSSERHFWFHKTDSIDFAVVLEGEIWMLLDDGECLLKAGDSIVQRGTSHSWSNRSDQTCRMAFVLFGALPTGEPGRPDEEELAGQSA